MTATIITDERLSTGVYLYAPKKFKTRPSTQSGNILLPVKIKEHGGLYCKYLLITDKTKIRLRGRDEIDISKDDLLRLKLIDNAKQYFVKGRNNFTNISVDYLRILT